MKNVASIFFYTLINTKVAELKKSVAFLRIFILPYFNAFKSNPVDPAAFKCHLIRSEIKLWRCLKERSIINQYLQL